MTQHLCDRCGQLITGKKTTLHASGFTLWAKNTLLAGGIHLCEPCTEALAEWLKPEPETPQRAVESRS